MFKVNNKDTRTTPSVLVFEQVKTNWGRYLSFYLYLLKRCFLENFFFLRCWKFCIQTFKNVVYHKESVAAAPITFVLCKKFPNTDFFLIYIFQYLI